MTSHTAQDVELIASVNGHIYFDPIDDTGYPRSRKRGKQTKAQRLETRGIKGHSPDPYMRTLVARTKNQSKVMASWASGKNLNLLGVAGTGKTYVAIAMAMKEVIEGRAAKLIIVRSIVPTRDIGFLPGSRSDKTKVYEAPYYGIFAELFGSAKAYDHFKSKGMVEFTDTSFVRGITFTDAVIVVDEVQNLTFHECDGIITRLGEGCRIIFSGDYRQTDLQKEEERRGLSRFVQVLDKIKSFARHEFTADDIVRSATVKDYILAKLELGLT